MSFARACLRHFQQGVFRWDLPSVAVGQNFCSELGCPHRTRAAKLMCSESRTAQRHPACPHRLAFLFRNLHCFLRGVARLD